MNQSHVKDGQAAGVMVQLGRRFKCQSDTFYMEAPVARPQLVLS